MVTIYTSKDGTTQKSVHEDVNDIRDLLLPTQFLVTLQRDAVKAVRTLGSANVEFREIHWRKNSNRTIYTDYILNIK